MPLPGTCPSSPRPTGCAACLPSTVSHVHAPGDRRRACGGNRCHPAESGPRSRTRPAGRQRCYANRFNDNVSRAALRAALGSCDVMFEVVVCWAVHNGEAFLREALDCLTAQTLKPTDVSPLTTDRRTGARIYSAPSVSGPCVPIKPVRPLPVTGDSPPCAAMSSLSWTR